MNETSIVQTYRASFFSEVFIMAVLNLLVNLCVSRYILDNARAKDTPIFLFLASLL